MSGPAGQATVEYAGLLGLAIVIGGVLALIAGPPLGDLVRNALAGAISGTSRDATTAVLAAADIADVQSALDPGGQAVTPDAALLALGQRHPPAESVAIADELLLAAVRRAAPWVARRNTYRAWTSASGDPYQPTEASDPSDRDVESVTGVPVVTWITVARQRRAIEAALAPHTDASAVVLDAVGMIPFAKLPVVAGIAGARSLVKVALRRLPDGIDALQGASSVGHLVHSDDGGVPPAMRAGDVVVAWPVERTLWRDGRTDRHARIRYVHRVVLRPGADGLAVIAQGFGT